MSRFGHRLMLALILVVVLAGLVLGAMVYGGYRVTVSKTNLPNLVLDGIPVGGLTETETAEKLREQGWDRMNRVPLEVVLPLDISFKLDRLRAGTSITVEQAADDIFRYGHGLKWFDNLDKYMNARFSKAVEPPIISISPNESYIRANVREAIDRFSKLTEDNELHVDKDNAVMTMIKGGGIVSVSEEGLYSAVLDALSTGKEKLNYKTIDGEPGIPDFEKVYDEIASESQNAYFSPEDFELVHEVVGCTFEPGEAMRLWEAANLGEQVTIPLTISIPDVLAEDLEGMLYRDRLCFMTTSFWDSSAARINNIDLAAKQLDGVIVMPGQVFSYNETIGQRTEDAGYRLAGAYADGEVIEEVGGGICQVSSTLYCAAMYAQMTTISRTNHYFAVSYLSMGYDATVSWKQPDYRFRNDRDFPVKILTFVDGHSVTIEFWGTNVDGSHVSPYTKSYEIYDTEYPDVLIGYGVTTVRRILDANDNVIDTIEEPTGIYHLHDEDIAWPEEKRRKDEEKKAAEAMGLGVPAKAVWEPAVMAI